MSLRLKAFIGLIALMTLVQLGLGVWQWNRRAEKQAFLAAIETAAAGMPETLAGAGLWHRVSVTGRFLHEKTAYVRSSRPDPVPGARDSNGRQLAAGSFGVVVMTPFVTQACEGASPCPLTTLYVNRGFVPTPPDGKIPAFARPEDTVTLTGFLRPSERASLLQPGNDPARGIYFFRTIEEMAKAAGLLGAGATPSPYTRFLDRQAEPEETAPPFGISVRDFLKGVPNNHFEYALTWWALGVTNLLALAVFLVMRRKQTADPG
jgi:surfeit locus 1 family protein